MIIYCCKPSSSSKAEASYFYPPSRFLNVNGSVNSFSPWLLGAAGPSWFRWTPCRTAGHRDPRRRSWRWCARGDASTSARWPRTPLSQTRLVGETTETVRRSSVQRHCRRALGASDCICHQSPLTLSDGAGSKVVHLHGDGKVLQVVEKLEEGSKLIKGDSLKKKDKRKLSTCARIKQHPAQNTAEPLGKCLSLGHDNRNNTVLIVASAQSASHKDLKWCADFVPGSMPVVLLAIWWTFDKVPLMT